MNAADNGLTHSAGSATETTAAAARPRRPRAPHLYEIDIVRILTFASVIAVHTTSHTVADDDLPLYLFLGLAHFTREVFFAITTFVLVYTYRYKPTPALKSLPRRFLLVGVPYLVWSAIYVVASYAHSPHGTLLDLLGRYVVAVLTGSAWYHLYFLLVTMQVYILMPVILWLVRVTRGKHALLLGVAFVIQAAMAACFMYWPDVLALIAPTAKEYFFIYVFFILAGAVAADHSDTFLSWVRRRRGWIGIATAVAAVITLAVFLVQIALGASFYHAGTPLQPIIIFWSIAIGMGLLAFGTWWADRRKPGSATARVVDVASDRSFGIFLAHPLFIWLLLWVGNDWLESVVPTPWLTLVTYVLVIALAWGLSDLARRTPLSLPLAGRPFRPRSATTRRA